MSPNVLYALAAIGLLAGGVAGHHGRYGLSKELILQSSMIFLGATVYDAAILTHCI